MDPDPGNGSTQRVVLSSYVPRAFVLDTTLWKKEAANGYRAGAEPCKSTQSAAEAEPPGDAPFLQRRPLPRTL